MAPPVQAVPLIGGTPGWGTVIDFEGQAEGTVIDNEYAGLGVTFSQTPGVAPQIDNKDFLFAYESGSGEGVLTGTATTGTPATTAGLIGTFDDPVSRAGAFFSDTVPLGSYTFRAFGAGGVLLESFVLTPADFPHAGTDPTCDGSFPFNGTGCGIFVGFEFASPVIVSIQFGPSSAFPQDAFAIDDFRFEEGGVVLPEPAGVMILGAGLVGLLAVRRRLRRG